MALSRIWVDMMIRSPAVLVRLNAVRGRHNNPQLRLTKISVSIFNDTLKSTKIFSIDRFYRCQIQCQIRH